MYRYELVKCDANSVNEYSNLLSITFPNTKKFTPEFISWQYIDNPLGTIVGFNAYAGEVLAAHYVGQPITAIINGEKKKGLLSLNTATHPDHRGKKLFTTLANKTYEYAAKNGYDFVYGVANANSTHGFVKRLGFQLVGALDVKIGVGKFSFKNTNKVFSFRRDIKRNELVWRLNNPSKEYFYNENVIVPTGKIGLNAILMCSETKYLKELTVLRKFRGLKLFKLYVGINNSIEWKKTMFFNLPDRFKSSPLNLIFKDISGGNQKLDISNVKLQIIDFDGY